MYLDASSINAPHGISEWALCGLTPAPCTDVKCSRVKEAVFSVEGKLFSTQEFESRATPGKKTGVLAIVEGTRFWVREDALNEDRNLIDPAGEAILDRLHLQHLSIRSCRKRNTKISLTAAWPGGYMLIPIFAPVLRPMSRLGGIMYGRTVEGCELPRPGYEEKKKEGETDGLIKEKVEGQ